MDKLLEMLGVQELDSEKQEAIKEKTGTELGDMPHVNRSNREEYKKYYDEETYDIIKTKFKRDIDYFKFEF